MESASGTGLPPTPGTHPVPTHRSDTRGCYEVQVAANSEEPA